MRRILFFICLVAGCMIAATAGAASPKAKHVIYIGLDGWGAYSVSKADMPAVKELMEKG